VTGATLIRRSLRFYRRTHLGVVLGAAVSVGVLVGALAVGDSVRYTLERLARQRMGETEAVLAAPDRFFRAALADELAERLQARTAPVLRLAGSASKGAGAERTNLPRVQVLGVDERFWRLAGPGAEPIPCGPGEVILNERAAGRLGAAVGDAVRLRIERPALLPRDAPLSTDADASEAAWLRVAAVATDEQFGRFSLDSGQVSPATAFVPLGALGRLAGLSAPPEEPARANLLLVAGAEGAPVSAEAAQAALREAWLLADLGLALDEPVKGVLELRSDRVFLSPEVARAARGPEAMGVLTYLATELGLGDRASPYAFVAAVGLLDPEGGGGAESISPVPPDMKDDEIVINEWLRDDLGAAPGDTLRMTYSVLGPGRSVEPAGPERFRVREVIPIEPPLADRTLLPRFPGLADAASCTDWRQQDFVDLARIRPKDEAYWKDHRGTPKALVTLAAGRRLWASRFGDLTAMRFADGRGVWETIEKRLRERLDPAAAGLFFETARRAAEPAEWDGMGFGELFLGLSLFLLAAALVLMGLVFALGVEQRSAEIGTLLALGFRPRQVRRLLVAEGAVLAAVGTVLGVGLGAWYTRAVLRALRTVWSGAVGGAPPILFHVEPATLGWGAAAGMAVALGVVYLAARGACRRPARALLAGEAAGYAPAAWGAPPGPPTLFPAGAGASRRGRAGLWFSLALAGAAGAAVLVSVAMGGRGEVPVFFAAGAALLAAGLGLCRQLLAALDRLSAARRLTLPILGIRGAARRRGRSLATIALVACGSFLVVAVGANRRDPLADASNPRSGTGGFALWGESALPVWRDLADPKAQQTYGLDPAAMRGVRVVALRAREGDEASCRNLVRVTRPRLLGVRPEALAGRFTFAEMLPGAPEGWRCLERRPDPVVESLSHYRAGDPVVPAVGDEATLRWSLGKKVGDVVAYTDERGETFSVRLAGALAGSVLQGSLVVAEEALAEKFPSSGGGRVFLVDAPAARVGEVRRELERALGWAGLALEPAAERLGEFLEVENTYLAIFQALGALGLALGTVGLAAVVARNVLERRGELALLRAVGYSRRNLARLVVWEHWGLLGLGLGCGVSAALVAVAPALRAPGAPAPAGGLALTLLAVAASGLVWTWAAARLAVRGPLLEALREE